MAVKWNQDVKTDVPVMDNQHKKIFRKIEQVTNAINHNRNGERSKCFIGKW